MCSGAAAHNSGQAFPEVSPRHRGPCPEGHFGRDGGHGREDHLLGHGVQSSAERLLLPGHDEAAARQERGAAQVEIGGRVAGGRACRSTTIHYTGTKRSCELFLAYFY